MSGDSVSTSHGSATAFGAAPAVQPGHDLARRGGAGGAHAATTSSESSTTVPVGDDATADSAASTGVVGDTAHAAAVADQAQGDGVYIAPAVGPRGVSNLSGPFTPPQLTRIDEALTVATRSTGLLFSLYVGALAEPTRSAAESMTARVPAAAGIGVVLLAVSPGQRVLHVVTARGAGKRLPNRVCALAALGMRAAFAGGDITGGVVNGLRMLSDAAGD